MRIDGGDPTRMAWRYRLALGLVAALAIGSFLVLTQVISRERATAGIINVSGQQRFLSQRGALFVGRLTYPVPAQDQQDARQHLAEVIAQMRSNHEALLKGGSNAPESAVLDGYGKGYHDFQGGRKVDAAPAAKLRRGHLGGDPRWAKAFQDVRVYRRNAEALVRVS